MNVLENISFSHRAKRALLVLITPGKIMEARQARA
jgi:hypothetical protein